MKAVRDSTADTATRLAFEFLVLTVARAGEVREANWSEIDPDTRNLGCAGRPYEGPAGASRSAV